MNPLPTVLTIRRAPLPDLPARLAGGDVRFAPEFARLMIERFTRPGECVLDPFAGFGTTLVQARALGRECAGIELLPERAEYARSLLDCPERVFCCDARELSALALPRADFVLTSPPYMARNGHPEYPLAGYAVTGEDYGDYLRDLERIFAQLRAFLRPGAYAAVEVSNIISSGQFTPLAWDVARAIGRALTLERELILDWRSIEPGCGYGFGFDHSYCLIFRAPSEKPASHAPQMSV